MEEVTMKFVSYFFTYILTVFLTTGLTLPALSQGEKQDDLIGHWTFEKGVELEDLTGHFGDIELRGAKVDDGKLHLGNNEWGLTTGYKGPQIGPDKTLVTWIYLDDLNVIKGATIAVNKSSEDTFDAIVYGEKHEKHWMAGSSFFRRTHNDPHGTPETETGKLIQLAISYEDDNNNAKIMIYRNGIIIGDYTLGPIKSWTEGDVEALFGPRALIAGTAHGWVVARVEDARIYNAVLSEDDINNLEADTLDVEPLGKLATIWGNIKK